jgi:F-type H+-transporting ATPase subunit epsilon
MVLELITPDGRKTIRGVRSVVFQANDGQMGILPGHAPLICRVDAGMLIATLAESRECFATGSGMAHVDGSSMRLLLLELIPENEILRDAAWAALEAAEQALALPECASQPDLREHHLEQLRFARAQVELAKTR